MYYVNTYEEIQQYDRFKGWVLGLLVLLLIPILWIGRDQIIQEQMSAEHDPGQSVEIIEAPPGQPQITPEPTRAVAGPSITLLAPQDGATFNGDNTTVSGTADPGSTVEIIVNDQSAGHVAVGSDGNWHYDIALPQPGDYRVGARALDAQGREQAKATAILVSRLSIIKPVATPAIAMPSGAEVLAIGDVAFSGTGEPGKEVVMVADGKEVGHAKVGQDGNWSAVVRLEAEEHDVHVYTLDDAGNALMSNSVHVKVESASAGNAEVQTGAVADSDSDGVEDTEDKCMDTAAGTKVNAEGCPEAPTAADADGDAVADAEDTCPGTPAGVKVDAMGCPLKGETLLTLTGVTFENDEATIRPDSIPVLDNAVKVLQDNVQVGVHVEGHTDDRGDEAYNLYLSQQRADAVRQYLIDHGIAGERLDAVGKGETQPLVSNDSEEGRLKNRRVEFVVK